MEKRGEKKANVVTLKGRRERTEGGMTRRLKRREGKLFVREREEASQHD